MDQCSLIDIGHGNLLCAVLALSLVGLGLFVLALQDSLAILVQLQLGDDALRGVDSDLDGRTCNNIQRLRGFSQERNKLTYLCCFPKNGGCFAMSLPGVDMRACNNVCAHRGRSSML